MERVDIPGVHKIFVMNLARRKDRRDRICEALDGMGLTYQVFDALDGKALRLASDVSSKYLRNEKNPEGHLPAGRIAGFLTRSMLFRESIRNNYGNLMILEDDAVFAHDFVAKATLAVESLPADWDMLYFGHWEWKQDAVQPVNDYIIKPGRAMLQHCVLYSPAAQRRIVEILRSMRETSDVQISWDMRDANIYATKEQLARQRTKADSDAKERIL